MTDPIPMIFAETAQYSEGRHLQTQRTPFIAGLMGEVSETVELRTSTGVWQCDLTTALLQSDIPDSRVYDVSVHLSLASGHEDESDVAVSLQFADWSPDNYVLLPAAIYAGNRFDVRDLGYPPLLESVADLGAHCPTIISGVPRLAIAPDVISRFQQSTRDLAMLMVVLHLPGCKTGIILQTPQEISPCGDLQYDFSESRDRSLAALRISAPGVRDRDHSKARRSAEDRGARFASGTLDSLTLSLRIHVLNRCDDIPSVLNRFMLIRRELTSPDKFRPVLPFSAAFDLIEAKTNRENWNEQYSYIGCGTQNGPFAFWQLGWVGGMINTFPLLADGSEESRHRACRTFDFLLSSQTKAGLFWPIHDGEKWVGDGFGKPHAERWLLTRRCGDALYFLIKQFDVLKRQGHPVRPEWENMARRHADALVKIWEANGQWGQFVDCETGEIAVGNSTSAGLVPGALALASAYFGDPAYCRVAEEGARFFYDRFVLRGYTTGGPGEALQCPDSESAFGLLESFVEIAELTQAPEWIEMARDTAHLCATWCTPYDFRFPADSLFGQLDMRTTGAVWANVQNKHGAPNICTLSGVSLFKLYRFVTAEGGDGSPYLDLLREIAHNQTQYVSRPDRPIGGMPPGYMNERVNLSDWAEGVGEIFYGSCWPEVSMMLTWTEIPGVYVRCDTGLVTVFDNITAEVVENRSESAVSLRLCNPTPFPARVKVFTESASELRTPLGMNFLAGCPVVPLAPGEVRFVNFLTHSGGK